MIGYEVSDFSGLRYFGAGRIRAIQETNDRIRVIEFLGATIPRGWAPFPGATSPQGGSDPCIQETNNRTRVIRFLGATVSRGMAFPMCA